MGIFMGWVAGALFATYIGYIIVRDHPEIEQFFIMLFYLGKALVIIAAVLSAGYVVGRLVWALFGFQITKGWLRAQRSFALWRVNRAYNATMKEAAKL